MNHHSVERNDEVIVHGTTGTICSPVIRGRVMITWHDENGMEHTKTVWAKNCEILKKYND